MYLLVFLFVFLLILLLVSSVRISVEFLAKDDGITYTIKGSYIKYIKVFEIKSGSEKKGRKRWKVSPKEKKYVDKNVYSVFYNALRNNKGKILHIEKLELAGTFSAEDAALNAIIYGVLIVLWNYLIILLSALFSLERSNFNLLPDFRDNRNKLIFHAVFRVVLLKILFLVILIFIKKHEFSSKTHSF